MDSLTDTISIEHSIPYLLFEDPGSCTWFDEVSEVQSVQEAREVEALAAIADEDLQFAAACRPHLAKILADYNK